MIQVCINPYRTVIAVNGIGGAKFLQGLMTNDIYLLDHQPCIYACFLTAQGKFLHDFHIFKQGNSYFLTPEKKRAADLVKRLKMYKLRAAVDIQNIDYLNVFHFLQGDPSNLLPPDSLLSADPRHEDLGYLALLSENAVENLKSRQDGMGAAVDSHLKEQQLEEIAFDLWDTQRIQAKVPDGSRDMMPEKAILLEYGLDNLNAISYEKGCYLGQELTARTHYRGIVRKGLEIVTGDNLPETGIPLFNKENEKSVATMASSCKEIGLVLIKQEENTNKFPLFTENREEEINLLHK